MRKEKEDVFPLRGEILVTYVNKGQSAGRKSKNVPQSRGTKRAGSAIVSTVGVRGKPTEKPPQW